VSSRRRLLRRLSPFALLHLLRGLTPIAMLLVSLDIALMAAAGAPTRAVAAPPQSGIVKPDREPSQPSVKLGSELYAGNCSTCHGIAGSGISSPRPGAGDVLGEGPPLRGVGAEAADFYLRNGYMPLGSPHMQPYTNRVLLTDKEIRSLDEYVASLGSGPRVPNPHPGQGDISQGMHLFTEHCSGCHQEDARGGYAPGARVPPLQGVNATQIAEAVRIGPYLMPKFSRSQISDAELNSIIKYVLLQNDPQNRGGWGIGNIGPIPEGLVTWWIAIPLLILSCLLLGKKLRP
jgi:ubiquinol-cytochrome c reductase cytochrome c subunit